MLRNRSTAGEGIVVVDFERAELSRRSPLGLLSWDHQNKKRKRGFSVESTLSENQGSQRFAKELDSVVCQMSRYVEATQEESVVDVARKV